MRKCIECIQVTARSALKRLHCMLIDFYNNQSTLSEEAHSLEKDNMELVKTSCEAKVHVLVHIQCHSALSTVVDIFTCYLPLQSVDLQTTFRLNTDPKKLSFPLNESELERQ